MTDKELVRHERRCVDCVHVKFCYWEGPACQLTKTQQLVNNPVTGSWIRNNYQTCDKARQEDGACGPAGKNYKRQLLKFWRPR